jgi:riboflavin synthase
MFTGLVEGIGRVRSIHRRHADMTVNIVPPFDITDCQVGDSIAVDGVCLTVTGLSEGAFTMDVSGETLSRSTLRLLRQGSEVNLERALRLSDRLGGHLVLGHVDGMGKILSKELQQRSWVLKIGIDPKLSRYIIEKGSITIDGISLTVNQSGPDFFGVNIIAQTGRETTLLRKQAGDPVNIETDLIGKYVEKLLLNDGSARGNKPASGIDLEMLIRNGFGD